MILFLLTLSIESFCQREIEKSNLSENKELIFGTYIINPNSEKIIGLHLDQDCIFKLEVSNKTISGNYSIVNDTVNLVNDSAKVIKTLVFVNYDSLKIADENEMFFVKKRGYYYNNMKSGEMQFVFSNSENCYVRHGMYKIYYSNGRLKYKVRYVNGKMEGKYKVYLNGKWIQKGYYKNDLLHGKRKERGPFRYGVWYYENGKQIRGKNIMLINPKKKPPF
jgi:hypothetical protein